MLTIEQLEYIKSALNEQIAQHREAYGMFDTMDDAAFGESIDTYYATMEAIEKQYDALVEARE